MRSRGRSIRRKIVALLLVPLVSLIGVWAYAAFNTTRDAVRLLDAEKISDTFARPVEDTLKEVQKERRQALRYLADTQNPKGLDELRIAELATDKRTGQLRKVAGGEERTLLDQHRLDHLDEFMERIDGLRELRGKVVARQITRADAFDAYTRIIASGAVLHAEAGHIDEAGLDREVRVLHELMTAREAVSRVDALVSAALLSGRMSVPEHRHLADAVTERRMLERTALPELPRADRAAYSAFTESEDGKALRTMEDRLVAAGATGAPAAVEPAQWSGTAETALAALARIGADAYERHESRTEPYAKGVLVNAVVVGALGLLAVLASCVVSVRIGRRLVRDLTRLRKAAIELAGTRLPRVMRRLAAGEELDTAAEAPPIDFAGDEEIRQVGEAFNDVQRAAVEAAVKQAELRRGISKVFVNLARRSQVLLQRQLSLLDEMERRTEDAEELADLFRLDHMTTRMRRHAEGLVILSGASPSRAWRNPVLIVNVVRAAIAEVEDYERVEVRRMPRISVIGPAVGDLTHLLAELVENATVFSPPHTQVQVHGERVANGFVLEIDDRGLGLAPEQLLEANQRLAETPEFELSDTDRLGLFVVSRLAQRHGVRVSLRPSPYGGTTAVVLIPNALLTDEAPAPLGPGRTPAAIAAAGSEEPDEETETSTEEAFRQWGLGPLPPPALASEDETEQHDLAPDDEEAGPLPRRRRTTPVLISDRGRAVDILRESASRAGAKAPEKRQASGGRAARPPRRTVPARRRELGPGPGLSDPAHQTDASAPPGGEDTAASGSTTGIPALPRRIRQASLAPQLRADPASRRSGRGSRTVRERSAEEVRARMASFQRGWERGRASLASQSGDGTAERARNSGEADPDAPARRTEKGDGR